MLDDTPRLKLMADKLQIEVDNGRLKGEFPESFIPRVRGKIITGKPLTPTEEKYLEKLFGGL